MPTFAIIETGGKQYRVSPGKKIHVEKLDAEAGASFAFDKVLLIAADTRAVPAIRPEPSGDGRRGLDADPRGNGGVTIGTPYIAGAKVEAKVVAQGRDDKKIVFRYHSKTRYRKKKGHRQPYTELEIIHI